MRLNRDDRRVMRAIFGHRVRFDEAERRLYESDLWRPPSGVRRLVRSMPDAVVLPEDETDLVELTRFAHEVGVPLVPRGGGTAFNGGSMPVSGGIVVDFAHMSQRFEPQAGGEEVRVGAGMTFASLKARLASLGRAPVVEPVFPEATTVGGWFATGGPGFGSNQYGPVEKTVRSARVVLPDGTRRVFADHELDVIAGACGSTGFVTTLTLRTRPLQEPDVFLASFDDLKSLAAAFEGLRTAVRWWTIMVETPETAALKAEALGTRPPARNAFLVMGAIAGDGLSDSNKKELEGLVKAAGGKVVDAKKTAAWWSTHSEVYRAKALGPSMVSSSMVVPTEKSPHALARVHDAVKAGHWLMTLIVAGEESLLVGYALDDERRPNFEVAYGSVLAMQKALRGLGGRPASLGVQSAHKAHLVLDPERLERLQDFKNAVDREGLMNPGKITPTPMARMKPSWAPGPSVQGALAPGEPILRAVHGSTYVRYQRREEARAPYKVGLSAALGSAGGGSFGAKWAWDVVASDIDAPLRHASASARAFGSLGSSPLGWLAWIKAYMYQSGAVSAYQFQMLAGEGIAAEAEHKSGFGLRYSDMLIEWKAQLLHEGFRPMRVHREIEKNCLKAHNQYGEDNAQRAAWAEGLDLPEKGATLVFADDAVGFHAGEFAKKAVSLLKEAGEDVACLGANEHSSGHVLLATGQHEAARSLMEYNAKAIKQAGAKTVVTLDPLTHHAFTRIYPRLAGKLGIEWDPDVKFVHVYELLAKHKKAGKLSPPEEAVPMALHHPPVFHLHGIDEDVAKEALSLFGIDAVVLPHHGRDAMDVGASGAVAEAFPEITHLAGLRVLEDAAQLEKAHLVSSDPASGRLLAAARDGLNDAQAEGMPLVHVLGASLPRPPTSASGPVEDEAGEAGRDEDGASGKDEEQAAKQAA